MTRTRWFLLCLVLILFLVPFLAKFIQSVSIPHPPNVPENWERHRGGLGRFEVWLPKGWKDVEKGRVTLLSSVLRSDEGEYGMIIVSDDDLASEIYAPLVGAELARECSRHVPVSLTLDFDGGVYLDATNVVVIEQEDDRSNIAYQSAVLRRDTDKNLVRTVACMVSEKHVFLVYLDTTEIVSENGSSSSTYERILKAFYVTE